MTHNTIRTPTRPVRLAVDIDLPRSVTYAETQEYVARAIRDMGGALDPESPFFGLRDEAIRVVRRGR